MLVLLLSLSLLCCVILCVLCHVWLADQCSWLLHMWWWARIRELCCCCVDFVVVVVVVLYCGCYPVSCLVGRSMKLVAPHVVVGLHS